MTIGRRTLVAGLAGAAALPMRARGQSRQTIKLGILADMTGTYRDLGGPLIEPCVRQAIRESGVTERGIDVQVLVADHLNKVDTGLGIALEWMDRQGVDALVDISNSALAIALAPVVRDKDKVQLNTGAGTSDLTGKACTPNLVHWSFDSWESAHSTCVASVKLGGDTWFFITPDYAFGTAAQRDATEFIAQAGGKVLGSVGLLLTETFYWDLNDRTRAFTKRVQSSFGDAKPNPEQAGAYSGVLHYLKVAAAMGAPQAKASGRAAMAAMKATPTEDDVFGPGHIREDGQKLHPAYLFQVKAKSESRYPWDYYKLVATTPFEEAFRPMNQGGCPMVSKT